MLQLIRQTLGRHKHVGDQRGVLFARSQVLVAGTAAAGVEIGVLGARAHGGLRDDVLVLARGRWSARIANIGSAYKVYKLES